MPRLDLHQIKGHTDVDPVSLMLSLRATLARNPQRWPGGRCGGSHTRALGRPWGAHCRRAQRGVVACCWRARAGA
eukprot:14885628-Alexandrium_andersonii.AAC.1